MDIDDDDDDDDDNDDDYNDDDNDDDDNDEGEDDDDVNRFYFGIFELCFVHHDTAVKKYILNTKVLIKVRCCCRKSLPKKNPPASET